MNRDIATQGLEVLTLTLGGQVFAIEAAHVREILDLVVVTEVPTADPFVGGADQCPRQGRTARRSAPSLRHAAPRAVGGHAHHRA